MVNSVAVQPRGLKVSFNFLPKGKKYIAHIYTTTTQRTPAQTCGIESREVTADSVFEKHLSKQGGVAIRLTPKN